MTSATAQTHQIGGNVRSINILASPRHIFKRTSQVNNIDDINSAVKKLNNSYSSLHNAGTKTE